MLLVLTGVDEVIGQYFRAVSLLDHVNSEVWKVMLPNEQMMGVAKVSRDSLAQEWSMLLAAESCPGVPRVVAYQEGRQHNVLVTQPLGIRIDHFLSTASPRLRARLLNSCAEQLVSILGSLHLRGIIHGDVKPSNVIITSEEPLQCSLIDFGSAVLVGSRVPLQGTPVFASTNARLGRSPRTRDDLESLVLTLHALSINSPCPVMKVRRVLQQAVPWTSRFNHILRPQRNGKENRKY
jgi:serine/threonine protein kinase